jgi:aspartate/methionine/tyrosine aminotransferase
LFDLDLEVPVQYPSPAAADLPASGIREIVNLVLDQPAADFARLEIGEPDSLTPPHIVAAAQEAMTRRVGYVQSSGTLELRSAIVDRLHGMGTDVSTSEIVVSQGAVQAIAAAFAVTLQPGDEVLVPDPGWPNYEMQAMLFGAVPVRYPLRAENGFLPDPAEVESLFTARTRVIVLNSPSNPAGSVADAALVERLVLMAADRGVLVVSDEVYDEIIFDGEHVGARPFAPESVMSVYSFSKTYSMTGWRVGYGVVPSSLSVAFERVQETLLSCVSLVSQVAAVAALRGPQDAVTENLARYRRRRDLAVSLFTDAGIDVVPPRGAFYLMAPLAPGADSRLAALDLVRQGVSVAPGSAFGDVATDQIRLNLASPDETIIVGVERILNWYEKTEGGLSLSHASALR